MATRGYITIQYKDGTCQGFYNHWDNYPTGTGMTLLSTPGCATGDLKTVQKALNNTEKEWVFTHAGWLEAFDEGWHHGCEWFYLRKHDTWYCIAYNDKEHRMLPVAEAILEQIIIEKDTEYEALLRQLEEERRMNSPTPFMSMEEK